MDKLEFITTEFPTLLKQLDPSTRPLWGKMNVQQMIEHMIDSVREANGKTQRAIVTEEDKLPAYKNFLMSEKEFRPETKNPLMPDEPIAPRFPDKQSAILELENELGHFVNHYKANATAVVTNAIFGHLNYEEWIQLLYKHSRHHLKQFGVI